MPTVQTCDSPGCTEPARYYVPADSGVEGDLKKLCKAHINDWKAAQAAKKP
jgi:hypothetical protein